MSQTRRATSSKYNHNRSDTRLNAARIELVRAVGQLRPWRGKEGGEDERKHCSKRIDHGSAFQVTQRMQAAAIDSSRRVVRAAHPAQQFSVDFTYLGQAHAVLAHATQGQGLQTR